MHDFTELDKSVDLKQSKKYHLSIQLMQDGFSFFILEHYIGRYVGARHYNFKPKPVFDDYLAEIQKILANDNLLSFKYSSVSLMLVGLNAFLIPSEVFRKEDIKTLYEVNTQLAELEELHFNYVPGFSLYTVFAAHSELLNLFRDKFSDLKLYHQRTSILNNRFLKGSTGKKVLIGLYGSILDVVVVNDGNLIFSNSFKVFNENDFVFYLLNVYKQLKLDTDSCKAFIMGDTDNRGKYISLLGRYIRYYEIADVGDEFSCSPHVNSISKSYFYNLYNLYSCVLSEENTGE